MSKRIHTYEDLVEERQRLETLLEAQKELIGYDFDEVKQKMLNAAVGVGKIFTRDTGNLLLTSGSNKLIDLVVKKLLLSRAGRLTRLVVPFLLKNYSSHYIADHKEQWINKLFSWIGRKNQNGKAATEPEQKPY